MEHGTGVNAALKGLNLSLNPNHPNHGADVVHNGAYFTLVVEPANLWP